MLHCHSQGMPHCHIEPFAHPNSVKKEYKGYLLTFDFVWSMCWSPPLHPHRAAPSISVSHSLFQNQCSHVTACNICLPWLDHSAE